VLIIFYFALWEVNAMVELQRENSFVVELTDIGVEEIQKHC